MENINRREKFHRMNPQRGWPFPCRIYFFSSFYFNFFHSWYQLILDQVFICPTPNLFLK